MTRTRRPLLAGNWKMFGTRPMTETLLSAVKNAAAGCRDRDVLVAPPYPLLATAAHLLAGSSVFLAAQDVFWEEEGPYTGEVSAGMLVETGCTHVIIGHSERRQLFGENDETVRQKMRAALDHKLTPILCVGETSSQREENATLTVIDRQVRNGLAEVDSVELGHIVIAYEPLWAIGTGKVAAPAQAQEVHAFIRSLVGEKGGKEAAASCRILYGGSVKPDNIDSLMREEDIDGALVGGASLKGEAFARIVRFEG